MQADEAEQFWQTQSKFLTNFSESQVSIQNKIWNIYGLEILLIPLF
jgi:hypothetical protein